MQRFVHRAVHVAATLVALVVILGSIELSAASQAEPLSMNATLATVEPRQRRVAVLPEGESRLVDLFVPEDASITRGEEELTLGELVILVGSRVKVDYRMSDGRRDAERITVEVERQREMAATSRSWNCCHSSSVTTENVPRMR